MKQRIGNRNKNWRRNKRLARENPKRERRRLRTSKEWEREKGLIEECEDVEKRGIGDGVGQRLIYGET